MVRGWMVVAALGVAGCGGEAEPTGPTGPQTNGGACGEVTNHDVTVRGKVVDVDGNPVSGAELRLVEDGWNIVEETYGSAVTGADGTGEFLAANLVSVEDCWGTVLNYTLTAQLGQMTGEMDYNSPLFNAINDGSLDTDTTGVPIDIQ